LWIEKNKKSEHFNFALALWHKQLITTHTNTKNTLILWIYIYIFILYNKVIWTNTRNNIVDSNWCGLFCVSVMRNIEKNPPLMGTPVLTKESKYMSLYMGSHINCPFS